MGGAVDVQWEHLAFQIQICVNREVTGNCDRFTHSSVCIQRRLVRIRGVSRKTSHINSQSSKHSTWTFLIAVSLVSFQPLFGSSGNAVGRSVMWWCGEKRCAKLRCVTIQITAAREVDYVFPGHWGLFIVNEVYFFFFLTDIRQQQCIVNTSRSYGKLVLRSGKWKSVGIRTRS